MPLDAQPRALQEYTRVVSAGGFAIVSSPGEFVFVKAAARTIRCILGGKTFDLIAGDFIRVERFDEIELYNDNAVDVTVVVVVGFGEYRRMIVQGQISAVPGLMNAAGEVIPDTRRELSLLINPRPGTGYTETAKSLIKTLFTVADFQAHFSTASLTTPDNLSYNPDHDDLVYGMYLLGGPTKYIVALDPYGGTIETAWTLTIQTGDPDNACAAYDGNFLYVGTVNGAWGLYRGAPARGSTFRTVTDLTRIYSGGRVDDVEIASDGSIFICEKSGIVKKLDQNGTVLASVTGNSTTDIALINGELWGFSTNGNYKVDRWDMNLNHLGYAFGGSTFYLRDSVCGFGYYMMGEKYPTDDIGVYALADTTIALDGVALEDCGGAAQLFAPPSIFEAARIVDAVVTVTHKTTGEVIVTGELIRMALEWYRRRAVASDYLDHIEGVDIVSAVPVSATARSHTRVQLAGQTFQAAGILDSFSATLPARMTITLDNGLDLT